MTQRTRVLLSCCVLVALAISTFLLPSDPNRFAVGSAILFLVAILWVALVSGLHRRVASVGEREIGFALLVALLFASRVTFPDPRFLAPTLDDSWRQGLGHALANGMRFGVDVIFNHGPLGYFRESPPLAPLFGVKVVWWEGFVKLAMAIASLFPLLAMRGPLIRGFYLFAVFLPLGGPDHQAICVIAALAFVLLQRGAAKGWITSLAIVLLAILALVKFTWFMLAAACLGIVCLDLVLARDVRRALRVAGGAILALAALWIVAGQSLADFPSYVAGSLAISSGYNVAMVHFGPPTEVKCAIAAFALAVVLVASHVLARSGTRRFAEGLLLLAVLLLAFKAGMLRHTGSSSIFFGTLAVVPFLLFTSPRRDDTRLARVASSSAVLSAIGIALIGYYGPENARDGKYLAPQNLAGSALRSIPQGVEAFTDIAKSMARSREIETNLVAANAMPRTKAAVGDATIDVLGFQQGLAFLNGLDWHPRPVFQNYSAYETKLLEWNRAFYAGSDAPRFILFSAHMLDSRSVAAADTLAVQEMLRGYEPLLVENEHLLFERRRADSQAAPEVPPREVLFDRQLGFDEVLALPPYDGCRVLEIDFQPTLFGRLESLFFHTDLPRLEILRSDGGRAAFRIIPDEARAGFLVDPLPQGIEEWRAFVAGDPLPRPTSIKLMAPLRPMDREAWVRTARVRILAAPDLVPRTSEENRSRLNNPVFDPRPASAVFGAPPRYMRIGVHDTVLAHATTTIEFTPRPGRHRISLVCGILDEAWKSGISDGVVLTLAIEGTSRTTILERVIDPRAGDRDRAPIPLSAEFAISQGEKLVLRVDPGAAGDSRHDWCYVGDLVLRGL
jgi:uncharacterized membrane protein